MMPPPERLSPASRRGDRIAAVVVLYHPGVDLLENIASYGSQVDVLFAVDNSEGETSSVVRELGRISNVTYRANGRNLGVARALNIGAELAMDHGCDYLLTMDQDSRAEPGMVAELFACLGSPPGPDIGIVAPFLSTKPGQAPPGAARCEDVPTTMTSGSLLSLAAYRTVGPFLDELFVDFVDIEYCLRLRSRGFRIVLANRAVLTHHVGQVLKFRFFSRDFHLTSHSPLRKYYKTRNRFFVTDRYKGIFPAFRRADLLRFWLETLRLLFFEADKREKLVMMGKGYRDYRRGLLGRFDAGGART